MSGSIIDELDALREAPLVRTEKYGIQLMLSGINEAVGENARDETRHYLLSNPETPLVSGLDFVRENFDID